MAIKMIIDTTEATKEELDNFKELMGNKDYFLTRLYEDKNIEAKMLICSKLYPTITNTL